MIKLLNQGWVGSLMGLIGGLAISYVFFRISQIGQRPTFQFQSRRLIGKQEQELPDEVEIIYNKQPVSRLTLSRIAFWNSGNATIDGNNITDADPLRLEVEDGCILKVHVIKATRVVNNFTVNHNDWPTKALLRFDFLDPTDGVVLEILHTSKKRTPKLLGTIRGVPKGIVSWGDFSETIFSFMPSRKIKSFKKIPQMALFVGMLIIAIAMFPEKLLNAFYAHHQISIRFCIFFTGIIYLSLPLTFYWFRRRRFPKSLLTEE